MITLKTVNLIAKILHPLAEVGTFSVQEEREIVVQLRSLAKTGEVLPVVIPKLIDRKEAADMLGLGLSLFRKLESDGVFPFRQRRLGTAIRYRNTDIVKYILADINYND